VKVPRRALTAAITVALVAVGAALGAPAGAETDRRGAGGPEFDVLVFSKTAGFRHLSIPDGIAAIRELGEANDFSVEATEEAGQFRFANLKRFEAVIFLMTTGTVLEEPQKRALMKYVRRGGGYVGVHSAADTEYDWPFYGRLVGAYFENHPIQQSAEIVTEARTHPATAHLADRFAVFDEFYSFRTNPRVDVRVLLTIDESTYSPDPNTSNLPGNTPSSGIMGDHPMSWCHDNLGGRAFFTALGHESYLYRQDWFRTHLLGGILTAAKQVKAGCKPRPR
jgi:type 1 glutamine amidotransferase